VNDSASTRLFAVIGNPVAHSRSPAIHAQFGIQTGIALRYDAIASPLDRFEATVRGFFDQGGAGLNVTVPFKEEAWALAGDGLSARARLAGAVNTLWMEGGRLRGCNTDGVGLLADLRRLDADPKDRRVLLVGAGGAAKGVVFPLLEAGCAALRIVNRREARALALWDHIVRHMPLQAARVSAGGLDQAQGAWDIVVNATSSSLDGQAPALAGAAYAGRALAYDMMYGPRPTPFMLRAAGQGAARTTDGLGMLVGQAAASFALWHGVMPDVEPVLRLLREQLGGG